MTARTLNVQGFIFAERNRQFYTVPFSAVKFYKDKEKKDLSYEEYTDLYGRYMLGTDVPAQDYYVTLDAPGFIKREIIIHGLETCDSDICTLHLKLKKKDTEPFIINTYSGRTLRKSAGNIKDALKSLGYELNGNIFYCEKYKRVKFIINGSGEIEPDVFDTVLGLNSKYLILVEEYDLRESGSEYKFDVVLNVVIPGEKADLFHVLDWTPEEKYTNYEQD